VGRLLVDGMAILFAETAIIEGDLFIFDLKGTSDLFGKPHVCCLNMLKHA
jgi:hypothetical protein